MHFFRYRPCSELSFKELLYSEIFFTSPEECNDPFDSKAFYSFPPDADRWRRLVEQALPIKDKNSEVEKFHRGITNILTRICPINLDAFLEHKTLGLEALGFEETQLLDIVKRIKDLVQLYIPSTRYFASFSRSNNFITMWSHYASNHAGFCLIFKSVDNSLRQCAINTKRQVIRKTNGLLGQVSYEFPESFEFKKVDYRRRVYPINAFENLSKYIYGPETNGNNEALKRRQELHYLQKQFSWSQEKEMRLVLPPPLSFIMGGHTPYTKQERLFHYEPEQLVGIIFGARMKQEDKQRMHEILIERKDRLSHNFQKRPFNFNFVIFEAKLSTRQREVEINPIEIMSHPSINPGDKDFERLYKEWQQGWGWKKNGEGSPKTQFK